MKKTLGMRGLVAGGAVALAVGIGTAGIASASTNTTSSTSSTSTIGSSATVVTSTPPSGAAMNPATLTHGPGETLWTGTELSEALAAAKAAEPGATVVRAETNSSGASAYEVHMLTSGGSYVTVELNDSFTVVGTVSGFGAGPSGSAAVPSPGGAPSVTQ